MKLLRHIGVVLIALFVTLGVPALLYADVGALFRGGGADAVSSASMDLPEQPSGNFVVLLNAKQHPDTVKAWCNFFSERNAELIFEDIRCTVAQGDAAGIQLAERYQARLAENQMELRQENGLLAVSKVQCGLFDVFILSEEAADAYQLSTVYAQEGVVLLTVKGAAP